MASPRIILHLATFALISGPGCATPPPASPTEIQYKCSYKAPENGFKRLGVMFKTENCSSSAPLGKHVIHEVTNVSYSHMTCRDQAAIIVHWSPSPLGIEHVKGFRVYLEEKDPVEKQCQHLLLKDPRQLNYSYKNTKLSSMPFHGLTFDMDYLVRVVPFPTFMNDSFFPPSFLRTNSCELLLGPDHLACKPFWRPKILNVSQMGTNLHVVFDHAPFSFGFSVYFLCYKLRQEGHFRMQRCTPDYSMPRTTCVLQDVSPGTYVIELRDGNNTTRRQTQFFVGQVHSPWAGPVRAMAITVPLVVLSAFATLFTVMCRKKQQENIYSQLDEESSESSNHSTAQSAERLGPRPKVFVCYSNRDCPQHTAVIQSFAYFLQDFCRCEVVLDLWEHLHICKEGQMTWLSRQLDEANLIIVVCSKGLRYHVERKSRRGKTPVSRRGNSSNSPVGGTGNNLFIVGVAMIAEMLGLARQREEGEGLRRYMAVYFDYSAESDIPTMLNLAPRFKLMEQLPQLLGRLNSDRGSQPLNASRRNYFRSKSGRSLYVAICNMHQHIAHHPDWFQKQEALGESSSSSSSSPMSPPSSSSASGQDTTPLTSVCSAANQQHDSSLLMKEVLVRTPVAGQDVLKRNMLLLAASTSPSLPACSLARLGPTSRSSSGTSGLLESISASSSSPTDSIHQDELSPSPLPASPSLPEEAPPSLPEPPPPRDSGIYDSSVPSSELSIPLLEGLSHDPVDSASLADSESSSSGLGDEEPPAVSSLHCSDGTQCKPPHHHRPLEHGDALTPLALL